MKKEMISLSIKESKELKSYSQNIRNITRNKIINITFANGRHPTCAIKQYNNNYVIYHYYDNNYILYSAPLMKELKRILHKDLLNGTIMRVQIIE